jgi:hypothetical protein
MMLWITAIVCYTLYNIIDRVLDHIADVELAKREAKRK